MIQIPRIPPILATLLVLSGCAVTATTPKGQPKKITADCVLFDGKSMDNWKITDFVGTPGKVKIEKGELILPPGKDMTGVTWSGGELPTKNYEIELDARRIEGSDFFCGLTFPVGKSHASLILGGWGGELCGISSLNGDDAANNETSCTRKFEMNKWYHVRMRVLPNKLQAWVDEDQIVDVEIGERKVDVRFEVEESRPLGVATWQTGGAIKDIKIKILPEQKEEP